MHSSHFPGWLCIVFLPIALSLGMGAQVLATSGPIPPDSVGLPPSPPFLTFLGKFVTDPSIPLRGTVAEVFRQELRGVSSPAGQAGTVETSARTKFDRKGHITEQIENQWRRESDTTYGYQDDRLVSMEITFPETKKPGTKIWNYWTYDASGKLMEYRKGAGTELQNHELNFKYDAKGRLLAFEYRQGADDKPFRLTSISYSEDGKRVEVTNRFPEDHIVDRDARFLDDQGRVVRVVLSSEGRAPNNEAKDIRFRYDEKNRLIEQTTDAKSLSESGAEQDLPPGTIFIAYDDQKHTKTTKYSFAGEGTMRIVLTQNETGATTGYSLEATPQRISSKFECEYDSQGNWTNCIEFGEQEGRKSVTQRFRRTITYRTETDPVAP